ncbi:class I SAM-dependent methyltransferase [Saccharothrix variisporea]|uniref:Methyltransferase family protein n=1 Tax=Saccharothrix variisporea TaxID=543527 RepID=A0A495X5P1_9PSEU|nr:class I SAM-dependent methyltransferase [Saccharothrix variisporea]RKT69187.1 methyltransferase family protein [Saccharothrix variisporea]
MSIDATRIFGGAADDYDRYRPDYPVAAVRAAVRDVEVPADAVDIGCGTGKFAAVLADIGFRVTGVEPDEQMAAVAARRGFPIQVRTFEDWRPSARAYDVVACAQAWHWLDPRTRADKVAECLRPDGLVLLAWNLPLGQDELDADLADIAHRVLPLGWDRAARAAERSFPLDVDLFAEELQTSGFRQVDVESTPWTRSYTAVEWARLVGTASTYRTLPEASLDRFLDAVEEHVDTRLGGVVQAAYACVLLTGRGGPR